MEQVKKSVKNETKKSETKKSEAKKSEAKKSEAKKSKLVATKKEVDTNKSHFLDSDGEPVLREKEDK